MVRIRQIALLMLLLGGFSSGCRRDKYVKPVFPGEHWEYLAPERVGLDADRLSAFSHYVRGAGCVVRHGYLVHHWGHYAHLLDVSSAVKPVYGHLVYMSIRNGMIPDLDSLVMDYEPGLASLNEALGFKDRSMTWRHLVTQTAGYGVSEKPGAAFCYSDYQMALLIDTLVFKVYETGYCYADEKLLNPMFSSIVGCQDSPTINSQDSLPGRLRISVRDFARFGLLYLNHGRWKNRQVVPRHLAVQAVSTPHTAEMPRTTQEPAEMLASRRSIGAGANQENHMNSYSYAWWLNEIDDDRRRVLPNVPDDAFLAVGHAGRDVLLVIPSLDLVACWMGGVAGKYPSRYSWGGRNLVDEGILRLLAAVDEWAPESLAGAPSNTASSAELSQ